MPQNDVTTLLQDWSAGDEEAFDRVVELVYGDLSRIARRHLRSERANHTLDTQALVHESYLNLVDRPSGEWQNRAQFYAVASRVMRRILIDYARSRRRQKRGGDRLRVTFDEAMEAATASEIRDLDQLLALEEALESLERLDERLARVVECRFFGGLSVGETAEALSVSRRTAERDWTRARAHLRRRLDGVADA